LPLDLHARVRRVEVAPPQGGQFVPAHAGVERERVKAARSGLAALAVVTNARASSAVQQVRQNVLAIGAAARLADDRFATLR
jgi:hypothetical protein